MKEISLLKKIITYYIFYSQREMNISVIQRLLYNYIHKQEKLEWEDK